MRKSGIRRALAVGGAAVLLVAAGVGAVGPAAAASGGGAFTVRVLDAGYAGPGTQGVFGFQVTYDDVCAPFGWASSELTQADGSATFTGIPSNPCPEISVNSAIYDAAHYALFAQPAYWTLPDAATSVTLYAERAEDDQLVADSVYEDTYGMDHLVPGATYLVEDAQGHQLAAGTDGGLGDDDSLRNGFFRANLPTSPSDDGGAVTNTVYEISAPSGWYANIDGTPAPVPFEDMQAAQIDHYPGANQPGHFGVLTIRAVSDGELVPGATFRIHGCTYMGETPSFPDGGLRCVTFTLTDGQPGDPDGTANGIINLAGLTSFPFLSPDEFDWLATPLDPAPKGYEWVDQATQSAVLGSPLQEVPAVVPLHSPTHAAGSGSRVLATGVHTLAAGGNQTLTFNLNCTTCTATPPPTTPPTVTPPATPPFSGEVWGQVRFADGRPANGAVVTLNGQSQQVASNGFYRFSGLAAGAYTVSEHLTGYADAASTPLAVAVATPKVRYDFVIHGLSLAPPKPGAGHLASTGGSTLPYVLAGMLLLVLGLALAYRRRRGAGARSHS